GSLKDTVGVLNPYRYRGYRYDTETGLYYLQSRYYNPEWGRFINADDTDQLDDTNEDLLDYNMFAYCNNNSVNKADNDGRFAYALYFVPGIGEVALSITAIGFAAYGTYKVVSWASRRIMYTNSKSNHNVPVGRINRKKQGREVNEKKRVNNKKFKSRSNKNPNRPMKKHTPSRKGHTKYY
ncbi:RHS repeat-associated core domain-containing protein, partial [Clostridium guangxiense]|uniref:RHS repeat-associated core domain-containing protein n=1 Tax=Clostridium guangxiense TaxID=1662055 RepID=UPI001E2A5070